MVRTLNSQSKVHHLKPLGDFKVNSAFYPFEVDQMNNKNSWGITFSFFVNNQGHAFALKLAYGFWGSKWLTMIA